MAWRDVELSCGHFECVQVAGPNRDRELRIAWLEENRICSACFQAKREAERAEADAAIAALVADMDLPELVGTEKQMAWATRIRGQTIAAWTKPEVDHTANARRAGVPLEDLSTHFWHLIATKTSCRWWIDHEFYPIDLPSLATYMRKWIEEQAERRGDVLLQPSEDASGDIVRLTLKGSRITLATDRKLGDDFIGVIHGYDFTWGASHWVGEGGGYDVPPFHVAAALVADLMEEGISVVTTANDVVELVKSDTFDRPNFRRVLVREGRFEIHAEPYGEARAEFMKAASAIKGSRLAHYNRAVSVPKNAAPDVVDLAQRYGADLTSDAQELVATVEQIVVPPSKRPQRETKRVKVVANPIVGAIHADLADD